MVIFTLSTVALYYYSCVKTVIQQGCSLFCWLSQNKSETCVQYIILLFATVV